VRSRLAASEGAAMIDRIARLYAQGKALSEIGDVLDVSRSKVAGAFIERARRAMFDLGQSRRGRASLSPLAREPRRQWSDPRRSLSRRRSGSCWST
jgi:hypothetical protein